MEKSAEDVKREFRRNGITITFWAAKHGFSVRLVRAVLSGQVQGNYGKSHDIAVHLGLKRP